VERIVGKSYQSALHHVGESDFFCGQRKAGDVAGSPEDHVQIDAVVRSALGVQACVCEVAEVADQPGWDSVVGPRGFFQGGLDAALEEWELVVAFFFVRVAEDRWLFGGWSAFGYGDVARE
jgi:hypothetical protein